MTTPIDQALANLDDEVARVAELGAEQRRQQQREEARLIGDEVARADPLRVEHTELQEMLTRCVFVAKQNMVVILPTETEAARGKHALALPLKNFESLFAQSRRAFGRGGQQTIPISRLWLQDERRLTAAAVKLAIGRGRIIVGDDGWNSVNLWTPRPRRAPLEADREDVAAFLRHIEYLVPVEEERGRFLDWLAHIEQRPEVLPHHGWLFWTEAFGVGRNWLAGALARVWRGEVAASIDLGALITSSFNGRIAAKRLAIVDEIHLSDSLRSIYAIQARFRQILTEATRHINHKYGAEYDEDNCLRWLIFSNHEDAMPLPEGDRRMAVVKNPDRPRDPDYYAGLYARLKRPDFAEAIGAYLAQRDISQFNPGATPPMNEAKLGVIAATTPELERELRALLADWPSWVAAASDLCRAIGAGPEDASARRQFAIVMRKLRHQRFDRRLSVDGRREQLWLLRDAALPEGVDPAATPALETAAVREIEAMRRAPWFTSLQERF